MTADREFSTFVRAPANIAWIKYWGKKGPQLPANPSLSLTLKECATETELVATPAKDLAVELFFDGIHQEKFRDKTRQHIELLAALHPRLARFHYLIRTHNTFPHSSGIASSASSSAALGLALSRLLEAHGEVADAGSFARLGSGSACRSLHGGFALWGETPLVKGSSDLHAVDVNAHVHGDFQGTRDTVLIVSRREKELSSRLGHAQMDQHPYAQGRNAQALGNLQRLWKALASGDWASAGEVIENEALSLHALMFAAHPGVVLLEPNTLEIIRLVRMFRAESKLPIYFTIDAGPNVHLLYPASAQLKVEPFIRHELLPFTDQKSGVIWDCAGEGAS